MIQNVSLSLTVRIHQQKSYHNYSIFAITRANFGKHSKICDNLQQLILALLQRFFLCLYQKKSYLYQFGERTLSMQEGRVVEGGGFYKFFKKYFVAQETIDLLISWPSNFFRKYFMAPPTNFGFLFKIYFQHYFRVVLSNIQISNHQRS